MVATTGHQSSASHSDRWSLAHLLTQCYCFWLMIGSQKNGDKSLLSSQGGTEISKGRQAGLFHTYTEHETSYTDSTTYPSQVMTSSRASQSCSHNSWVLKYILTTRDPLYSVIDSCYNLYILFTKWTAVQSCSLSLTHTHKHRSLTPSSTQILWCKLMVWELWLVSCLLLAWFSFRNYCNNICELQVTPLGFKLSRSEWFSCLSLQNPPFRSYLPWTWTLSKRPTYFLMCKAEKDVCCVNLNH